MSTGRKRGRPAVKRSEVVFFGKKAAVVRVGSHSSVFEDGEGSEEVRKLLEKMVAELLFLKPEADTSEDKQMHDIVTRGWELFNGGKRHSIKAPEDAEELIGFGFTQTKYGFLPDCIDFASSQHLKLVDLSLIRSASEALKFIARLYLAATGDERSAYIVGDVWSGDSEYPRVSGTVELPAYLGYAEVISVPGRNGKVDVVKDDAAIRLSYYFNDMSVGGWERSEDGMYSQAYPWIVAAAHLYTSITNATRPVRGAMVPHMGVDKPRYSIKRLLPWKHDGVLIDTLCTMIEDGRVVPCDYCGAPVARPEAKSRWTCKYARCEGNIYDACQLDAPSITLEELLERYPHIGETTVKSYWKVAHGEVMR